MHVHASQNQSGASAARRARPTGGRRAPFRSSWLVEVLLPGRPVSTKSVAHGVRAWATSLPRATGPRPELSSWAWLADAILARVLAAGFGIYAWRDRTHALLVLLAPLGAALPPGAKLAAPAPGGDSMVYVLTQAGGGTHWALAFGGALTALPLVVRRRYPLAAFCTVIGLRVALHSVVRGPEAAGILSLSCLVAGYSAARYSPYRTGAFTAVAAGTIMIAPLTFRGVLTIRGVYFPFLVLVPLGLAANAIHTWRQRALALEAEQEARTRLAVERERSRIARELHDVVTHNVSVMVVQAGAARKVIDLAPDAAREALLAVEAGGRAALTELRHAMGLLTLAGDGLEAPGGADLAPQPGLDRVPALAGRVRDTGVPVELTVTGVPLTLPAGVDLAAYRVVQEALTNTVKHAAGAQVSISIEYGPAAVHVEVTDTGGAPTTPADSGSGRGLIGLRERLAVYGGTLQAGRHPAGGYQVRAVIPVAA
ncbi:histidine kinase [Pseudofrankia sp. DC12]|uniref:sensor histidine kinase n=1 Tax=Pseudofrankia sp. DC12 TaxID=683315 RepID=UPI000A85040D|nr:histidine kinase [Pseudofrankia sp. DC12]